MPLNIDPSGYAKSVATPIPLYGGQGGGAGGGGGLMKGMGPLLQRIMAMRERQAQAELEMMYARMREPEKAREFEREMRFREKREREARERSERGAARLKEGPIHSTRGTEGQQKQDDYMKASRMAEALVGPGSSGFSRNPNPFALQHLTGMIGAIGPQAAHEGMMQSGRLMSAQGGAGATLGQARAQGLGETGIRQGGPIQLFPQTPRPHEQQGWNFDPERYQGREGLRSALGNYEKGTPLPKLSGRRSWGKPLGDYQGGTPAPQINFGSYEAALATKRARDERRRDPSAVARQAAESQARYGDSSVRPGTPGGTIPAGYSGGPGGFARQPGAHTATVGSPNVQPGSGTLPTAPGGPGASGAPGIGGVPGPPGGVAGTPGGMYEGVQNLTPSQQFQQARQNLPQFGGPGGPPSPGLAGFKPTPMAGGPPPVGAAPGTIPTPGGTPPGAPTPYRPGRDTGYRGRGGTAASSPGTGSAGIVQRGKTGFKTGGGVPETGTYKLHKGEMVIPTTDVDDDLVSFMIRKKIYDRAYEKTGGKPLDNYQGGTLDDLFRLAETGDTPAFREILRSQGMLDKEIDQAVYQVTRGEKGNLYKASQKAGKMKDFLQRSAMVPSGIGGPGVTPGIPPPGMKQLGPGTPPGYPKVGPAPSRGTRGLLKSGLADDAMRATSKLPGWLKTLGVAGGLGLGAYGLSQMETSEEEEVPEPSEGPRTVDLTKELSLRKAGEALRYGVGAITEPIAGGLSDFLGGALGVPEGGAAPSTDETAQLPGDQALQGLAGAMGGPGAEQFPEGSYEAASARVKAGDFGTPEKPLVLRGELSDIEQAQRDAESLPMYQEAKRKSFAAQREANAIYSMLAKEGRAMNPEVYDDLAKEADRKMKLSKSFDAVTERQEKSAQAMLMTSEKATQAILKELAKQQAIGSRQQTLEELKQKGNFTRTAMRGFAGSLPRLYGAVATGDPGDRARAQQQIAQVFQIIASFLEANAKTDEERDTYRAFGEASETHAEEFSQLSTEEAMAMIESLKQRFSATGELGGIMGGQQ